jgi:hypothetical protein
MAQHDVFISYKSEDYADASWLKQVLEQNGIRCWMAPDDIPIGSNYAKTIPQAIAECKIFLLFFSQKTNTSPWVSKELDLAINAKKTVVPFMIEECELHDEFNFYLTNVQRYDAYKSKSAAIEKMVMELWTILGVKHPSSDIVLPDGVNDSSGTQKRKGGKRLFPWYLLSYGICIFSGLVVTVVHLITKIKKYHPDRTYQVVKKWSIIASVVVGLICLLIACSV